LWKLKIQIQLRDAAKNKRKEEDKKPRRCEVDTSISE
jgi:hypothetical protein